MKPNPTLLKTLALFVALPFPSPALRAAPRDFELDAQVLLDREREHSNLPWFQDWHTNFYLGKALVDDTYVTYYRSKSAANPKQTILFIHGTPEGPEIWWPILVGDADVNKLAKDYDVIAIELPGHGTSTEIFWHWERDLKDYADLAIHLLTKLAPDSSWTVVAHSYGGEVAWRMVSKEPARFHSLALLDSSGFARIRNEGKPPAEVSESDEDMAGYKAQIGECFADLPLIGPYLIRPALINPLRKCCYVTDTAVKTNLVQGYAQKELVTPELVGTYKLYLGNTSYPGNTSSFITAIALTRSEVSRHDLADVTHQLHKVRDSKLTNGHPTILVMYGTNDTWYTEKTQGTNFKSELGLKTVDEFNSDRTGAAGLYVSITNAGHNPQHEQHERVGKLIAILALPNSPSSLSQPHLSR
jgi:pimeloyl-ACP methyl ester carboxylesterase